MQILINTDNNVEGRDELLPAAICAVTVGALLAATARPHAGLPAFRPFLR